MEGNWDNVFTKEQLWVLKEGDEALDAQLQPLLLSMGENRLCDNRDEEEAEVLGDPSPVDPNVLIPDRLRSRKNSILEKLTIFVACRLGLALDFSRSRLSNDFDPTSLTKESENEQILRLMAKISLEVELPLELNQYTYLNIFIIVTLKYLNDMEFIKRLSERRVKPFEDPGLDLKERKYPNLYTHLRYKFHKYKIQFAMGTNHSSMQKYNVLRRFGRCLVEMQFKLVNENAYRLESKVKEIRASTAAAGDAMEEAICCAEAREYLNTKFCEWVKLFGIKLQESQENEHQGPSVSHPLENSQAWAGTNVETVVPRVVSENSMYFSVDEPTDEVSLSAFQETFQGGRDYADSDDSRSTCSDDSYQGNVEVPHYLSEPYDYSWMNGPRPAKQPRRDC